MDLRIRQQSPLETSTKQDGDHNPSGIQAYLNPVDPGDYHTTTKNTIRLQTLMSASFRRLCDALQPQAFHGKPWGALYLMAYGCHS